MMDFFGGDDPFLIYYSDLDDKAPSCYALPGYCQNFTGFPPTMGA
jgi:hypothetical protein